MRTSKFEIAVRATIIVFVIYMMLAWCWNSMTNSYFWKPWEMGISAILTVLLFGGFAWLFVKIGMGLIYGRSQQYQSYRRGGGDPYFDSLPWPLNPDSKQLKQTGMSEPRTSFKPPANWNFQCPVCGAKQPSLVCVCWNCNYGADGDSTAYVQKYGFKPPELSEEQWKRAQRGESVNGPTGCEGGDCYIPPSKPIDDGYDGWIPVDERPNPNG